MADVVATERIWEVLPIPRTDRTRRVLRFAPGQIVPEADAKRLNVNVKGGQGIVPVAPEESGSAVPLPPKVARKAPAAKKTVKKKAGAKKAAARRR